MMFLWAVAVFVLAAVLFGSAGRLDLPFFWAYLGLVLLLPFLSLRLIDPGLLRERVQPGAGGQGRHLRLTLAPFLLAHFVVAGLDAGRFHWSGSLPVAVQVAGLAGVAAGLGLVVWSMAVNRFFSPVIRIQEERGHHLVTGGPYRFIRHPGYAGMVLAALCSGPALGSWWAVLPALGYVALILRRAAAEDRFLRDQLPGYRDFAQKVRWRQLPGVW